MYKYKPLAPLTGEDDEWNDIGKGPDGGDLEQNKRCSSVFRVNKDNATAHDLDAFAISDNGGLSWYSGMHAAGRLGHKVTITFPYAPPVRPKLIYVGYPEGYYPDDGFDVEKMIDITGNPELIKKAREAYENHARSVGENPEMPKERPEPTPEQDPSSGPVGMQGSC